MTKKGFLRDFQGVIGGFLRDFVAIAGFIIFFDYEIAEKSLGYLCTERDFWGVYRGMLGDSRTQKPRAAVAVNIHGLAVSLFVFCGFPILHKFLA